MSRGDSPWYHGARCVRRGEAFGLRQSSGAFRGGPPRQKRQRTAALQDAVAHLRTHARHRGGGWLGCQNDSIVIGEAIRMLRKHSRNIGSVVQRVKHCSRNIVGAALNVNNRSIKLGVVVLRMLNRSMKLGGVILNALTYSRQGGTSACMWTSSIHRWPATHRI